ncbi:hypothetical protein ABKA04_009923 [Annulohypoxylon sp. FPYF3050]
MASLDITQLFGGLVTNGAKVYVVALPSEPIDERVAELCELGKSSGGTAVGIACDVSSKQSISDLAAKISQLEDSIDLLVSNAGIRRDPPILCDVQKAPLDELQASMWSSEHSDWSDTFSVNTTAHYFMSVAFLPLLAKAAEKDRASGRGSIVVTSSCASMHNVTNVDLTSYAASKAATDHLVKLLAAKFSRWYIRCNSINPGFVPSKMNPVGEEGNVFSNLFDKVPARRAGDDLDIAAVVIWLSSRAGFRQFLQRYDSVGPPDKVGSDLSEDNIHELAASFPTSTLLKDCTIAVKDNISVGGLPTTLGTFTEVLSPDGSLPVSPIDSSVVGRILSAGGIIRGSSTCENHCASPLSFTSVSGPVHHPLLHGYTSGGSSSGSCALVAAHALKQQGLGQNLGDTVEFAIGSDQAGSVRIPSSFSGVFGLKPTFGLVPYTGAASMSPMIDHLGPIAPSLEGIATLLKVMAGYDGLDPRMTPESPLRDQVKDYPQILETFIKTKIRPSNQEQKPLRVGFLTESFTVAGLSPVVRDTVRRAAKSFEAAGALVKEVSIPLHSEGPVLWTASTRPSMSQSLCHGKTGGHLSYLPPHLQPQPLTQKTFDLQAGSNPALVNIMLSGQYAHNHFGPWVEAKAQRKVFELRSAYDKAFEEVDVLITPCAPTLSMPHPNPEAGILEKLSSSIGVTSNTCPFNVTGHPAFSVPCGSAAPVEHPNVKLPIGMQIIGRRWEDDTVLIAAALFEEGRKAVEI